MTKLANGSKTHENLKDTLKSVPPALDAERFLERADRPKLRNRFKATLSRTIP